MQQIEIKCSGAETSSIEELVPFQGDLKYLSDENYTKLKNQILKLGFSEPISVWRNGGKKLILNGHQRVQTLIKMSQEGYTVPEVPINIIQAIDEAEAKRKILSLTAQYGTMTEGGLEEFINNNEIDLDEIISDFPFPEINFDKINVGDIFEEPNEKELDENISTENKCPSCNYVW